MADLNIEQLMNNSEAMRMLKIGNPERSEDFDIPKLDVGLFDIERQLKEPLKHALYNSPDPNGTIAKFDTALMLNNLGIDLDTAHKMADMGYMSTATGINTKDKNYFEALKTTAQHAWWQEQKGLLTSLYRITGNHDFLKYANDYQSKVDKNPLFNEYGEFGDLVLSGVQPTMSSLKFIATTVALSWLPAGIGLKTGSKALQGVAKVGGVAAKVINFSSAGFSQAGNTLYDVINTEDAEGNKLPWDSPVGGVMFYALAGIMGAVELGSMEMFPWYRELNKHFTKDVLAQHIQKGMLPAIKSFFWKGTKGTVAEALEEGVQSLLGAGFENALKAMANKDGAEFELDSLGDTIKQAAKETYEAGKSMFLTSFLTAGGGQALYSTKMSLESKKNFSKTKTSVPIDPFFVNMPNSETKNTKETSQEEGPPPKESTPKGKENQEILEPIQTVRVGGRLIPANEAELEKVRTTQERGAKVLEVEVSEEIPISGVDQTALSHQAALATGGKILDENTVVYEDQESLIFAMHMLSPNIEAVEKTESGATLTLRNEEGTISTLNIALAREEMELSDPDITYAEDETAPYALSRMKEEKAYEWQERQLVKEKIGDIVGHTGGNVSKADLEANVDAVILVANTLDIPTDELLDKNVMISLSDKIGTHNGKNARGSIEQKVVDGKKQYVITLSKTADVSTLLHELGHTLRGLATPEQLADFKKYYGSAEIETVFLDDIQHVDGKFTVANKTFNTYKEASAYLEQFEERFANDFVAYLRTGQAPSVELKNIFSRMKAVLSKLMKEFGYRLIPEVKEAFDNLILGNIGQAGSQGSFHNINIDDYTNADGTVMFQGPESNGGIPTWHGSPYSFDKFYSAMINSGEGSQHQGWGLYFTTKAEVAKWYASSLNGYEPDVSISIQGKSLPNYKKSLRGTPTNVESSISQAITESVWELERDRYNIKGDDKIKTEFNEDVLSEALVYLGYSRDQLSAEAIELLKQIKPQDLKLDVEKYRMLYKTTIKKSFDISDYKFLDLYEKVPTDVVNRVVDIVEKEYQNDIDWDDNIYSDMEDFRDSLLGKTEYHDFTANELYDNIKDVLNDDSGKWASELLLKIGVDGHRYPSEAKGEYNYVVFDEDAITIENVTFFQQAPPEGIQRDAWFRGSKAVDADGNPLKLYHGSSEPFTNFDKDLQGSNTQANSARLGIFFTPNKGIAQSYADVATPRKMIDMKNKLSNLAKEMRAKSIVWSGNRTDWNNPLVQKYWELSDKIDTLEWDLEMDSSNAVMEVNLVMKNPLISDEKGKHWTESTYTATIRKAIKDGHDGVIFKNTNDPVAGAEDVYDQYVVFDDSQVGVLKYYGINEDYEQATLFQQVAPIESQAFKDWFKDSKIVDSEGKPMAVYHGSPSFFEEFSRDLIGSETDSGFFGEGFYFTPEKEYAKDYGGILYEVFLSIQNPFYYQDLFKWNSSIDQKNGKLVFLYNLGKLDNRLQYNVGEYQDIPWALFAREIEEFSKVEADPFKTYANKYGLNEEFYEGDLFPEPEPDEFSEILQNAGYDGIINKDKNDSEIVVFSSNQIKSVNNQGTWDANNPRILYQESIDNRYFKALENGDMETAQKIVDDQARKKGYISNNDFRMNHQAPNSHDDFSVNLANIENTDLIPDGYWEHPNWYTGDEEMTSFSRVKRAIERYKQNGSGSIILFRAIPKHIKEDMFRNGDWVTPDRAYAENEGAMIPEGYRIISHSVPLKYVWWDVNSIAELGYDDGNHYAYRDTLHNRKLTDVVVYDVEGSIVPPSKRFNYRSYTLYQQEFLPEYPEYSGKPQEAINHLLEVKQGSVPSAITRNEIGPIDFVYGKTGEKGFGLAHIIEKHPDILPHLVELIEQGDVVQQYKDRVNILIPEAKAAIRLDWNGISRNWLVTAYFYDEFPLSSGTNNDTTSGKFSGSRPDLMTDRLPKIINDGSIDVNDDPSRLYQLSPEAKQHLLDIRKDEVKTAVENFFYIPQDVLEEYAGEEWADDEIRFRVHLKENPLLLEEAKNYGIVDEYLEYIKSYIETGDYEFSLDDKMWFLRIHAYSKIQDPKQKDAQFVRLNTGTDKALIALGKELRGYEDVDYKGNTNRRNYDGRFVRYHWGSFKGVSTKVKRLSADSTAEELQEARALIKANPRPYRKAVQIVEAARARVQEMKGYISSGDVGRDEYYDALGEEMEEALNEPALLNGMTNRQAAEYLRTSSDKKERYTAREKLATHAGVYAMEQQANAELKALGIEKDSDIKKLENQLKTAQAGRNLYAKELKEEKKKYSEARSLGNSLGKALEERRARVKELRTQLTEANENVRTLTKKVTSLKNRIETRALKEKLEKMHKKILATVVFNSDSIDASFEKAFNVIHFLFEEDQRDGEFFVLPQQMTQYIADEQLHWVQQGKKITEWSLGDLEILYEAAQLMRSDAKVMLERKKVERMDTLQNISAQMYKQQYGVMPEMGVGYGSIMDDIIDDLTIKRDTYDENIFDAIVQTVRSSIGKMQRITRMLDGNKEGIASQLFVRDAYENMTEELRESYRRLTEADEKMRELKITSDLLAKDSFEYTTTSGQKKTLTIGEVIGLYVYSQNPIGTRKLVHNRGNNIPSIDLYKAIESLTEEEKAWGDYMIDNLGGDEVWERMNRTYIDVYNRNLGRRRRYFTFVADGKVDEEGKTDLLVGPQGAKVRYVDKDFTKIVKPHAIYPLKLNVTHTFTSQVKKQEHFVQWASWVRDMNYLLTKGAVGRIIEMNYGPKFMNVVQEYVNDVGSPQVILDDIERIGSKIISNAAVAALSLNFLTMLKQLPSFSAAVRGDVGVVELTNVALRLSNPKTHSEAVQFIHEMSPYMLKRSISIEVEKYNASDFDSFVGRKIQAFNENIGMKGIQMMDQAAVNTLWLAAYDTYLRRNPRNLSGETLKKEAAFRATQLISETQPTSIVNDLSSIQRKKNPWVRTALLFSNQLFQYVNMVWYDLPTSAKAYMATKDPHELRKMFGIVTNMAISGAMIVLVSGVAFRKDGEDDDDYWKRMRNEIMKIIASYTLPVIGGAVSQGISGYSGGDLVDLPSAFGRLVGTDWTDLDKISDRAWDLLDGAGSIAGLPTAFNNRVIKSVKTENPFEMFGSSYGDLWEKWNE